MDKTMRRLAGGFTFLTAVLLILLAANARAAIDGVSPGTSINLTAKAGHISTADGSSVLTWGYANGSAPMQYPGPTLIVAEGDTMTVNLFNELSMPVSIVFPGQEGVIATGGIDGLLTKEAPPGGSVSYSFTAAEAGTYLYYSGTRPEVQVEMGLVGALIVRPAGFNPLSPLAYAHADSSYDHEYLFLLTEMDSRIHDLVESFGVDALQNTDYLSDYFPNYWFINGRNAPDTMFPAGAAWLPSQPYNCMPMMHPGERVLMRVIGGGRVMHPYHHHGNHARIIARDGRLLESAPAAGADLSFEVFTIPSVPGGTVDAIFEWTGEGMGWDIYGTGPEHAHDCTDVGPADGFDDTTHEYCADHGKEFPIILPEKQEMAFGGFYSGSPFMGVGSELPPGEGGLNPYGGFTYMWHSHNEKEMLNFDIFPGGMMTMMIILPHGVPIP